MDVSHSVPVHSELELQMGRGAIWGTKATRLPSCIGFIYVILASDSSSAAWQEKTINLESLEKGQHYCKERDISIGPKPAAFSQTHLLVRLVPVDLNNHGLQWLI